MDAELSAIVREMDQLNDELARLGDRADELAVARRRRIQREREAAAARLIAFGRNTAREKPRIAR